MATHTPYKPEYEEGDVPVPGYRVMRELGRGSFGTVWQAIGPGRVRVALKILNIVGAGQEKEFEAMGIVKNIHHPFLTKIYGIWMKDAAGTILESDDDPHLISDLAPPKQAPARPGSQVDQSTAQPRPDLQGTIYAPSNPPSLVNSSARRSAQIMIAMGLGEKSLHQRLGEMNRDPQSPRRGIPREELLRYMEQLAEGLDYLNFKSRVIHRDIKPQNMLLVGGVAQVCDFGLARRADDLHATTTNAFSAAYCAPEAFDPAIHPTPAADQYSLAISYYELRTGELPFSRATLTTVMNAKSTGVLRLDKLPTKERQVLQRATSVQPEKRFATCGEFVQALRACPAFDRRGSSRWAVVVLLLLFVGPLGAGGVWLTQHQDWLFPPVVEVPKVEPKEQPEIKEVPRTEEVDPADAQRQEQEATAWYAKAVSVWKDWPSDKEFFADADIESVDRRCLSLIERSDDQLQRVFDYPLAASARRDADRLKQFGQWLREWLTKKAGLSLPLPEALAGELFRDHRLQLQLVRAVEAARRAQENEGASRETSLRQWATLLNDTSLFRYDHPLVDRSDIVLLRRLLFDRVRSMQASAVAQEFSATERQEASHVYLAAARITQRSPAVRHWLGQALRDQTSGDEANALPDARELAFTWMKNAFENALRGQPTSARIMLALALVETELPLGPSTPDTNQEQTVRAYVDRAAVEMNEEEAPLFLYLQAWLACEEAERYAAPWLVLPQLESAEERLVASLKLLEKGDPHGETALRCQLLLAQIVSKRIEVQGSGPDLISNKTIEDLLAEQRRAGQAMLESLHKWADDSRVNDFAEVWLHSAELQRQVAVNGFDFDVFNHSRVSLEKLLNDHALAEGQFTPYQRGCANLAYASVLRDELKFDDRLSSAQREEYPRTAMASLDQAIADFEKLATPELLRARFCRWQLAHQPHGQFNADGMETSLTELETLIKQAETQQHILLPEMRLTAIASYTQAKQLTSAQRQFSQLCDDWEQSTSGDRSPGQIIAAMKLLPRCYPESSSRDIAHKRLSDAYETAPREARIPLLQLATLDTAERDLASAYVSLLELGKTKQANEEKLNQLAPLKERAQKWTAAITAAQSSEVRLIQASAARTAAIQALFDYSLRSYEASWSGSKTSPGVADVEQLATLYRQAVRTQLDEEGPTFIEAMESLASGDSLEAWQRSWSELTPGMRERMRRQVVATAPFRFQAFHALNRFKRVTEKFSSENASTVRSLLIPLLLLPESSYVAVQTESPHGIPRGDVEKMIEQWK